MTVKLDRVLQGTVTLGKGNFRPYFETFEKLVDFQVRAKAAASAWPYHKPEALNLTISNPGLIGHTGHEMAETPRSLAAPRLSPVPFTVSGRRDGRIGEGRFRLILAATRIENLSAAQAYLESLASRVTAVDTDMRWFETVEPSWAMLLDKLAKSMYLSTTPW